MRKPKFKAGRYRRAHKTDLKSSISEAKKFGKIASKLAKLGGPISVLVDVSSAYASASKAIQLSDDGHSELATLYTTSAVVSGGAVLGGVLLAAPYLISAAAGIGMIPVIGWAIVILSVFIGAVILVLIGNATLTPTQLWLKHCYWGKEPYAKVKVRNEVDTGKGEAELYLDYSTMKNNIVKELDEIQLITSSFTFKAWWYRSTYKVYEQLYQSNGSIRIGGGPIWVDSDVVQADYKKSLVVDFIVPNWVDGQSCFQVIVKAYPKLSESKKPIILSDESLFPNSNAVQLHTKIPVPDHKPKKTPGSAENTIRYTFSGVTVDADKYMKIEIFGYYYPFGLNMNKILPNRNGIKMTLEAPISRPFTKAIGNSYKYQRNNLIAKNNGEFDRHIAISYSELEFRLLIIC